MDGERKLNYEIVVGWEEETRGRGGATMTCCVVFINERKSGSEDVEGEGERGLFKDDMVSKTSQVWLMIKDSIMTLTSQKLLMTGCFSLDWIRVCYVTSSACLGSS